jgi:hypothetical protein
MTLTAETRIETGNADRYLDELCRQLDARSHAKPELGVRVSWTDTEGSIDFGWGRCAIRARETSLHIRAEATDRDALRQVRELITRHLEKLASSNEHPLTWQEDGAPVSDSHIESRDAMRSFHRRMRH